MTQSERDSYYFAETVRKMATAIVSAANAEKWDAVTEQSLSLLQQAVSHKRAIEARQDSQEGTGEEERSGLDTTHPPFPLPED